MKRLLLALFSALAFALPASASVECPIEMALPEQLGPPDDTSQIVSVIPYDASTTGAGLRVCWAPLANKDALSLSFQTPPSGVTCSAADTSWTAAERVDLTMTGLTAGTRYWYKIQCDAPDAVNPGNLYTDRGVENFQTLPAAGVDQDFMFTVEADPHYGSHFGQNDEGYCQRHDIADGVGLVGILPGWENMSVAIAEMAQARGVFHVNLGDFYQTDAKLTANSCPSHLMLSPARGPSVPSPGVATVFREGELADQIPGFPTRMWSGPDAGGGFVYKSIQTAATDANVFDRALWRIWKYHSVYNSIFRRAPLVFVWGNHDNPLFPIGNTAGDCPGPYLNDGQGPPVAPWTHMLNAWQDINVNPATVYSTVGAGGVDDGYYYTFPAGDAQFWVLNVFEDSGGKGTGANTGWDGSGQFPESASDWSIGAAQYAWFSTTFAASTAKWKFVMLHHAVGGMDSRAVDATSCYWYGRGTWLATEGRFCDANADTVNDGLPTEKPCTTDDIMTGGYNSSQDTRPAAWVATNGACDTGVACIPTPYNNRTADLLGDHIYGQQAIQALLEANIDDGGSNFVVLGHDHQTVGGCKEKADGCAETWYITGGQPHGSWGDGDEAVPDWAQSELYAQYFDGNGDTVPDYRTDGAPNPTPLDSRSYTIRKRGSQLRGFFKVYVSNEGVRFDHQSVEMTEFAGDFGTTVVSFAIGEQAIQETDLDGTAAADGESKHSASTPTVTGTTIDCDYATSPAPLEGTQSCHYTITTTANTVISDAGFPSSSALTCMDWMMHVLDTANDAVSGIGTINFRGTAANLSGLRLYTNAGALPGDYALQLATRAQSGGEVSDIGPPMYEDRTYMMRMCAVGSTDTISVWADQCDLDDLNCDGESDSTPGTKVSVPTWGAGTFWTDSFTATAPSAYSVDGYRFGGPGTADQETIIDAIGVCDHNPGEFKCGDGFE